MDLPLLCLGNALGSLSWLLHVVAILVVQNKCPLACWCHWLEDILVYRDFHHFGGSGVMKEGKLFA